MVIDDGKMLVDLTLDNESMAPKDAFFLQGGLPAPGVTPVPTPGIYYSWPQLNVTGSIRVDGKTYKVPAAVAGWITN